MFKRLPSESDAISSVLLLKLFRLSTLTGDEKDKMIDFVFDDFRFFARPLRSHRSVSLNFSLSLGLTSFSEIQGVKIHDINLHSTLTFEWLHWMWNRNWLYVLQWSRFKGSNPISTFFAISQSSLPTSIWNDDNVKMSFHSKWFERNNINFKEKTMAEVSQWRERISPST